MSGPQRVRISPALASVLGQVGGTASAAHRALLILGAHAAGYDLSACRRDLALLLAEDLDAPVRTRLQEIAGERRTDVGRASYASQVVAAPEPDDDPFGVGIEV